MGDAVTPSVIIRPAGAGDVRSVAAIYGDAVVTGTGTFEIDPPGDTEMARRLSTVTSEGYPFLVAVRNEAVLGFAYANAFRARAAFNSTVEDSIYVARDACGQGIGRHLLGELIGATEARGFRQMLALIGDSENHASIAVHRGAGFTHAGVLRCVGFKHGRWLDVVVMQRALVGV